MCDNKFTTIELFSGPGGLALGFHMLGFKTLVAYEYEKDCISTYKNNFPETEVIHKDLSKFNKTDINELKAKVCTNLGTKEASVLLVMGGPPCRSFSTSNPKKTHGDHRDFLYKQMIKVAKALNAKYFLMENVEDITTKSEYKGSDKKIFHCLLEDLQKSGYKYINFKVLNADDFGIPQSRERLFILATNDPNVPLTFPIPISKEVDSKITVNQAFEDLPSVSSDSDIFKPGNQNMLIKDKNLHYCNKYMEQPSNEYTKYCRGIKNAYGYYRFPWINNDTEKLTMFITPYHTSRIIRRYNLLMPDEGQGTLLKRLKNELSQAEYEELLRAKVLPSKVFKQKNRRLVGDMPSRTVTSHAREELVHPLFNRNLTAREVARLQSFPDWYEFVGTNQKPFKPQSDSDIGNGRDFYQQIGDAVPPLLAAAIAKEIKCNINNKTIAQLGDLRSKIVKYIWKSNIRIRDINNDFKKNYGIDLCEILTGRVDLSNTMVKNIKSKIRS